MYRSLSRCGEMLIPGLCGRSTNCATSDGGDRYAPASSSSSPATVAITRTDRRARGKPRCCRDRGVAADAVGTIDLKLDTARAVDGGARRIVAREA